MYTRTYFYLNRPGPEPPDFTGREYWLPRKFPLEFPRGAFGAVTYSEALPFEQIWKYDLFPQALLGQVVYIAWQDAEKDTPTAIAILDQYWQMNLEALQKAAERDLTAWDVCRLKQAGITWPQVEAAMEEGRIGYSQEAAHVH